MSESPASDGAIWRILIFVGLATLTDPSGPGLAALEGTALATTDAAFDAALPFTFPTGALADSPATNLLPSPTLSPSLSSPFVPVAVAYSDSFSPTQVFANHRPPAIPRISRWATRQWRTFLPVRSRGMGGAKPVAILTGGMTGKGLVGRGY